MANTCNLYQFDGCPTNAIVLRHKALLDLYEALLGTEHDRLSEELEKTIVCCNKVYVDPFDKCLVHMHAKSASAVSFARLMGPVVQLAFATSGTEGSVAVQCPPRVPTHISAPDLTISVAK